MKKQHFSFAVTGTPRLDLRLPVGDMKIAPGAPGVVEITLDGRDSAVDRMVVEQRGDTIHLEPDRTDRIRWSSVDVRVTVGGGADVHARLTSGDFTVATDLASLAVETASGEISAGAISGDVTIRSASGDVQLGEVGGRLDVAIASGDIRAELAGEVDLKSASGDVAIREVQHDAVIRTVSGDVTIGAFLGERLDAKSMSGEVTIAVPPGRRYDVAFSTISGEIRTDFPVQGTAETGSVARLEVKTVSGDIRVRGI